MVEASQDYSGRDCLKKQKQQQKAKATQNKTQSRNFNMKDMVEHIFSSRAWRQRQVYMSVGTRPALSIYWTPSRDTSCDPLTDKRKRNLNKFHSGWS